MDIRSDRKFLLFSTFIQEMRTSLGVNHLKYSKSYDTLCTTYNKVNSNNSAVAKTEQLWLMNYWNTSSTSTLHDGFPFESFLRNPKTKRVRTPHRISHNISLHLLQFCTDIFNKVFGVAARTGRISSSEKDAFSTGSHILPSVSHQRILMQSNDLSSEFRYSLQ